MGHCRVLPFSVQCLLAASSLPFCSLCLFHTAALCPVLQRQHHCRAPCWRPATSCAITSCPLSDLSFAVLKKGWIASSCSTLSLPTLYIIQAKGAVHVLPSCPSHSPQSLAGGSAASIATGQTYSLSKHSLAKPTFSKIPPFVAMKYPTSQWFHCLLLHHDKRTYN